MSKLILPDGAQSSASTPRKSTEEYYLLIRSHLDAENDLIGQMLNWLVGSQAFLFIAYVSLLIIPEKTHPPGVVPKAILLIWLTPLTGLAIVCCAYCGILASNSYLVELRAMWAKYPKDEASINFPPLQGRWLLRFLSITSVLVLPPVFILSWVLVLVHQFMNSN